MSGLITVTASTDPRFIGWYNATGTCKNHRVSSRAPAHWTQGRSEGVHTPESSTRSLVPSTAVTQSKHLVTIGK
jgi:hypothetical protein